MRNNADLLPQQYANQPNLHTGNEEWVLFEVNMFPYQCFFFFYLLSKIFNLFLPLNVINRVIAGPLLWSKLNIARLSFLYLCSFTLALSVRLSTHTNVVISSISQWFFFLFFFSQLNDRLFWDDQTVNHVRRINKNMGWKTTELA